MLNNVKGFLSHFVANNKTENNCNEGERIFLQCYKYGIQRL